MAEDIRIAIIGHGFMGHEHEKMLNDFRESSWWELLIKIQNSLKM